MGSVYWQTESNRKKGSTRRFATFYTALSGSKKTNLYFLFRLVPVSSSTVQTSCSVRALHLLSTLLTTKTGKRTERLKWTPTKLWVKPFMRNQCHYWWKSQRNIKPWYWICLLCILSCFSPIVYWLTAWTKNKPIFILSINE